jgi:hypothetical protein
LVAADVAERALPDGLLAQMWQPSCPAPELVTLAAALLPGIQQHAGPAAVEPEGPRWEIVIAPGAIQVRTRDWARSSRYQEREAQRQAQKVDQLISWLTDRGEFPSDPVPSREITGWSRASRTNMVKTLCQLDYTPLFADPTKVPAMLTLTYPGDWLTVAPNGRAVKSHLKTLRKRYRRAWGHDLACVWKLEFQRRGAPHIHMLIVPPHGIAERHSFRQWISQAWADVVNHPDPNEYARHLLAGTGLDWAQGLRSTDPKRVAVYHQTRRVRREGISTLRSPGMARKGPRARSLLGLLGTATRPRRCAGTTSGRGDRGAPPAPLGQSTGHHPADDPDARRAGHRPGPVPQQPRPRASPAGLSRLGVR